MKIGISDSNRKKGAELLSGLLADEMVLYVKTLNFHWHVNGLHFHSLHTFFGDLYEQGQEAIDTLAERIRSLGQTAPGSMAEMLKLASLKEEPGKELSPEKMIAALLADHEAIIRALREASTEFDDKLGDAGTADMLVGMMETHEKAAWMLRASAK